MEGNNCSPMNLLSQHLHGRAEVEHDCPQHSVCDGQDSGWVPPVITPISLSSSGGECMPHFGSCHSSCCVP